jgi:predicted site-specific integrase-resolvase
MQTNLQTEFEPFVSLAEAAKVSGVCKMTVRNCGKRGELQIIQLSKRRVGIRKSELVRWLNSRATAA